MVMVQGDSSAAAAAAAAAGAGRRRRRLGSRGGWRRRGLRLDGACRRGGWENSAPGTAAAAGRGMEFAVAVVAAAAASAAGAGIDGVAMRARDSRVSCSSWASPAVEPIKPRPTKRIGPNRPTRQRAGGRFRGLGLVPPRRFWAGGGGERV